ncbi:reverse transcriptase domain-containing protein [Brevibacillus gelatini]|uniref:reverse transcriptase domain-containing protein n=1 Tax=Brevibacillus gelatini TaxID=1655277 RepID=UPI003CCC8906
MGVISRAKSRTGAGERLLAKSKGVLGYPNHYGCLIQQAFMQAMTQFLIRIFPEQYRIPSKQTCTRRSKEAQSYIQGGALSPLLANILLDNLDKEVTARGLCFVRYASDCSIFVRSKK